MKLVKLSMPTWTQEFATEADLRAELYSHICSACREGEIIQEEGEEAWEVWGPVDENSSLDEMLATGCGCEYSVEDEDDNH